MRQIPFTPSHLDGWCSSYEYSQPPVRHIFGAFNSFASGAEAQLGLQLVSIHKNLDQDVSAGLDLVKSYGIALVETAGTCGLTPQQFRQQIDAHGLKVFSAHYQYPALDADLSKVIDEAKILGSGTIVVPWIPHKGLFTADMARKAAADFNKWGKTIKDAGLRLVPSPWRRIRGASRGRHRIRYPDEGDRSRSRVF